MLNKNKISLLFKNINIFNNLNKKLSQKFKINNITKNIHFKNIIKLTNNNIFSQLGKKNFSTEDDGIHPDFKPKIKQQVTEENVMDMIDKWIKENKVVLFMKGNREMPRCGFSNYVVQILNHYNVKDIKVVNILENPIIREGVKKYSNWPTYPQLYVNGNLIGNYIK
jgi:monothiol glutaredoxin